jgi:hypothetical protein
VNGRCRRLSAPHMWIVKRLVPALLVPLVAWFTWMDFTQPPQYTRIYLGPILGVAFALIWYFVLRPVADTVVDEGDHLAIRRGHIEERIPLAEISDVTWDRDARRVRLGRRNAGILGETIVFNTDLNDWRQTGISAIADELRVRCELARNGARA